MGTALSLVLAVVLGLGGYFGAAGVAGISDSDSETAPFAPEAGTIAAGFIPTDAQGNNLIGNLPQNLYNGGLVAMQGDDIFYVNVEDGGSLYCADRNGTVSKLTDFAVANLNVSGNRLVFTDLAACSYIPDPTGSEIITLSADTHTELWDEAGEDVHITFGGNLYVVSGILDFCAGALSIEELVINRLDDGAYYQCPAITESGDLIAVMLTASDNSITPAVSPPLDFAASLKPLVATPVGMRLTPRSTASSRADYSGNYVTVTSGRDGMRRTVTLAEAAPRTSRFIQKAITAGAGTWVETGGYGTPNVLTLIDNQTGRPVSTIEGSSMQTDGDNLFFRNDGVIFKLDANTLKVQQVTSTRCDGPFTILPNGEIRYKIYDADRDELVTMTAIPQSKGEKPYHSHIGEGKLDWELSRLGANFGGSFYYYDRRLGSGYYRQDSNGNDVFMEDWVAPDFTAGPNAPRLLPPDAFGNIFAESGEPVPPPSPGADGDEHDEDIIDKANNLPYGIPLEDEAAPSRPESSRPQSSRPASGVNLSPDQCLDLLIAIFQGGDYSDSRISGVLSQADFNTLLQAYNVSSASDLLNTGTDLTQYGQEVLGQFGKVDQKNVERMLKAMFDLMKHFRYTVSDVNISGSKATVTINVTQQCEFVVDTVMMIITEKIQNYPGGQAGFVAMGEQAAMDWLFETFIQIIEDPVSYNLISSTSKTVTFQMERKASGLWVVSDTKAIASAMFSGM